VIGGTGLKGLTERLAAAGGSLVAGPAARGGFLVTAELPVESADGAAATSEAAEASAPRSPSASPSAAGATGRDATGGVMLKG
jgi:two-component system sensor histidine kinase DesK